MSAFGITLLIVWLIPIIGVSAVFVVKVIERRRHLQWQPSRTHQKSPPRESSRQRHARRPFPRETVLAEQEKREASIRYAKLYLN